MIMIMMNNDDDSDDDDNDDGGGDCTAVSQYPGGPWKRKPQLGGPIR